MEGVRSVKEGVRPQCKKNVISMCTAVGILISPLQRIELLVLLVVKARDLRHLPLDLDHFSPARRLPPRRREGARPAAGGFGTCPRAFVGAKEANDLFVEEGARVELAIEHLP